MVDSTTRERGTAGHRVLVLILSGLLTLLLVWLLGYVLRDIGSIEGPAFSELERAHVSAADVERLSEMRQSLGATRAQMENLQGEQRILDVSAQNSRTTMDQLMALHRLGLEKGLTPSAEEQAALAESQRLFFEDQSRFQEASRSIAELNGRRQELEAQIGRLEESLEEQRAPARLAYSEQRRAHEFRIASFKLAFLLPIFLLSAWLTIRKRTSPYRPIVHAALVATSWKVGVVMHDHFPAEFFRYIAIAAGILIVLAGLVSLIRRVASPRPDWLLKQYREAYRQHRCPVCSDPIQRGPLRHARWTRKGPVGALPGSAGASAEPEKPYTCPACGARLFEECERCHATRHSMLPYCEACGGEKAAPASAGP